MLGSLLFSGVIGSVVQAQPPGGGGGPPAGAFALFRSFFNAIGAGDLIFLENGGAISGSVLTDEFTIAMTDSEETQTYSDTDLVMMTIGDESDQLILSSGDIITGTIQLENLNLTSPAGSEVTLEKSEITTMIFQADFSNQQNRGGFFRVLRGLRAQNIFSLFTLALTTFDLAVFPDSTVWSGKILNDEFVFNSNLFGTLTLSSNDVSSIELSADPEEGDDFITFSVGDRVSGRLDEESVIQFQPLGLVDGEGEQVTQSFERGEISLFSFRLPASTFGGGSGPGLGGGP